MTATEPVGRLVSKLVEAGDFHAVFNPWGETDPDHDLDSTGPTIRREHLQEYLTSRINSAEWLLVGEGLSYNGGHFTGLAMTSERILLGYKRGDGIEPTAVLPSGRACRTSQPALRPNGFSEPTASMVWGTLLRLGLTGREFVLWNAFPWHPYHPQAGRLSNRAPTRAEAEGARPLLADFIDLFPRLRQVVAVGNVAAAQLAALGVRAARVRHPACGGARQFREQMRHLVAG